MKRVLFIALIFLFANVKLSAQITAGIIYLNSGNIASSQWDHRKERIEIISDSNLTNIVRYSRYYEKENEPWVREDYYDKIRLTSTPSVFYIRHCFKSWDTRPHFEVPDFVSDDETKIVAVKNGSLFQIKQFDSKNRPLCMGYSKTMFPFQWEGKLIEYYGKDSVKSELVYKDFKVVSEKYWTSEGIYIDTAYEFKDVDIEPKFKKSENSFGEDIVHFLADHLTISSRAGATAPSGTIWIRFIITKTGKIDCIQLIRGTHPLLDKSCMEAIGSLPTMEPAFVSNKPVNTWILRPIKINID